MSTHCPPNLDAIQAAHARIAPHIHRTPVLTSTTIDGLADARLYFKCENFQKIGAFKARGAMNAVMGLPETAVARGVATHSSGNHAAALAYAASLRGMPCHIVMPRTASVPKRDAVMVYGGHITECAPTLAAREDTLAQVQADTGAEFVHPFDDARVIAGQGTCAVELLEQAGALDAVIAPVGGGGLISGTSIATAGLTRGTAIYGAEPAAADDAMRSLRLGQLIPEDSPDTIADGLRTSLSPLTFGIIREHVTDILTVSEDAIVAAMRLIWSRMKIVIEPSCAVPLAAILTHPAPFSGKRVGVILTGGNVDLDELPWRD